MWKANLRLYYDNVVVPCSDARSIILLFSMCVTMLEVDVFATSLDLFCNMALIAMGPLLGHVPHCCAQGSIGTILPL